MKPKSNALVVSKSLAHPLTIESIFGSISYLINFTVSSPATFLSASICSSTVADKPGILKFILLFNFLVSISAACIRNPAADLGEACQCLTLVLTGNLASIPFKGSLIIPEKNPEAAKFGFPGLTQIVGNRIEIPSTIPFLE